MNLLELMLKEEVEWPVGAEFAAQSVKAEIVLCKYGFIEGMVSLAGTWSSVGGAIVTAIQSTIGRADDFHKRIITREEYQAAGGWMKWEGGELPFDGSTRVTLRWSDGDTTSRSTCPVDWIIDGDGTANIIAYRIIKQAESCQGSESGPVLFAVKETEGAEMPCDNEWRPLRDTSSNMTITVINKTGSDIDVKIGGSSFESFVSVEDAHECKAEHAATSRQSAPKGSGNPILGMVLADLTNRALEGKAKYGEPLKAHNGRNALWDAYQEALDLAMYLRQLIQEQQDA